MQHCLNRYRSMSNNFKIAESLACTITLNDGVEMPMFGLGVSKAESGEGGDAENAVTCVINNGYRLVDTATRYKYISCEFILKCHGLYKIYSVCTSVILRTELSLIAADSNII